MEFPLWALSLKTFHNMQSPSKTFWSHPFWDCCVYVQSCAHGHLLKGKTVLVALQVGFAGQPQQGKRPNKKAKYTEQNNCGAKTTGAAVRAQQHPPQISSMLLSGQPTWKLEAGSLPCWNLVQGLLRALYSMGNYPVCTETTQNIHSTLCLNQIGLTSSKDH